MKNLIIKKWIEPYRLLETVKKYCDLKDYTFDGSNKLINKNKMLEDIAQNKNKFGLYMKNVNKFYVFSPQDDFQLLDTLIQTFEFIENDYEYSEDTDKVLNMVDLGKSEASFINVSF